MKIAVYNIAAREGGALFVLKQFYADVIHSQEDHEWLFITQIVLEKSKPNVRVQVLDCGSLKKRLVADFVKVPQILKAYRPDMVISLQNTTVMGYQGPQYVYMHQSLQYCPYRFSMLKADERGMAVRQRLICGSYRRGLKRAKHIFVQTRWIQEATARWTKRALADITVVSVRMDGLPGVQWRKSDKKVFFYPARAEKYKNQRVLLEACKLLGNEDYRVILTVDPMESDYSRQLKEAARDSQIEFVGALPREKVFEIYANSILVFPSYLETCGLPLLEAALVGCPIIAADLPYAHEALDGYSNVTFFQYDDPADLAEEMLSVPLERGRMTEQKQGDNLVEAMLRCINS